jgi:hypothetical protein
VNNLVKWVKCNVIAFPLGMHDSYYNFFRFKSNFYSFLLKNNIKKQKGYS